MTTRNNNEAQTLGPRRIKWLGGPGGELRQCSECENVTRYWAVDENVPLCDVCAMRYRSSI